jgi:putative phosphoesterase
MTPRFESDNTDLDPSYCRFGAEALAKLLQTIESQVDEVEKSEDIEYVHKMRVTSRRIRATMPLFSGCFPKKRYKKWLNEVKKVTQFLGAARDLDVQIEFIKKNINFLQPLEPKTGMDALLEWHIEQRTNLQSNIVNGLEELEESRVLKEIKSYCEQIIKESTSNPFNLYSVREKAFWQISSKLDEFLAMEEYVHLENEILKHHEMRIRAKWLRYTMECYAALYPKELSDEIEMMKNFQDTLGEMHDCDVWIERVPKFIQELQGENQLVQEKPESKAEEQQGLLKFLIFIKEERKKQFEKFVSTWDTEKSKNAFEELRKNASAGFVAAGYRTLAELANPYVKIAVIAGIHANLDALEAVIRDAERRGITVFLNAGDSLGLGFFPSEVVQKLYSKNTLSVQGNYDLEVLDKNKILEGPERFAVEYARRTLAKSYEIYLKTMPSKLELEMDRKKLLMIYEIPDVTGENHDGNEEEKKFQEFAHNAKADLVLFGEAHEQFAKEISGVLFVNPGSVGRAGDGKPQAAYAAMTANPFSVELLKVDYNVEAAAEAYRRKRAPESYAQSLLRGVFLEDVIAEDKAKENDMETKCPSVTAKCRIVAGKYCSDMKHSEQVTKLSLELFESLQDLHKLGVRERCWLECAAVLHDIGLSQGSSAHHKNTLRLILNDTQLPFTSIERQVIGNIARYHRKGCPKNKHYSYMSLNRELRRKVSVLASILRLADGLDFSHQSIVESTVTQVNLDIVNVTVKIVFNSILEEQGFNRKKDLFEKTFAKKIAIVWKYQPRAPDGSSQSIGTGEPATTPNSTREQPSQSNTPNAKVL